MITKNTIWTTFDNRKIPLKDLEDTHLANVIRHVENTMPLRENASELLVVLLKIAHKRGLTEAFLSRAEIPYRDQDGHWMLSYRRVG